MKHLLDAADAVPHTCRRPSTSRLVPGWMHPAFSDLGLVAPQRPQRHFWSVGG
jgi:hypothetical protein